MRTAAGRGRQPCASRSSPRLRGRGRASRLSAIGAQPGLSRGRRMAARVHAGEQVELVSTFRSYDADGDRERQEALRAQGETLGRTLAAQWRDLPKSDRPALWFTYHLYYKAPDWLGPIVAATLGIPYVVAEASYAAKRAGGP